MIPTIEVTSGFYNAKANFNECKQFVNNEGWDTFMSLLQKAFPKYDLDGCSTSWQFKKEPKYICKASGRNGDIVLGWH